MSCCNIYGRSEIVCRCGINTWHKKMKVVNEKKRESAVRVACEFAFKICPVDPPVVDKSLRKLCIFLARHAQYQLSLAPGEVFN